MRGEGGENPLRLKDAREGFLSKAKKDCVRKRIRWNMEVRTLSVKYVAVTSQFVPA